MKTMIKCKILTIIIAVGTLMLGAQVLASHCSANYSKLCKKANVITGSGLACGTWSLSWGNAYVTDCQGYQDSGSERCSSTITIDFCCVTVTEITEFCGTDQWVDCNQVEVHFEEGDGCSHN